MAKHKVITRFRDLQDKNKIYEPGDIYPRPANKKISDERIEELMTKKSRKTNKPFIREIEEDEQK